MILKNKKADGSIGTAITVLISVVLGGLVLTGVITLIDNNVSPSMEKTFSEQQTNISRKVKEEEVYTSGDINKDGRVDKFDYQYLTNYIAGIDGYSTPNKDVGDLNHDGKINGVDLGVLRKKAISSEGLTFDIGDINKDGQVDNKDYEALSRYIYGWSGYDTPDFNMCDINQDGYLNQDDLLLLQQLV